jgi:hypothetical protein
VALRIGDVGTKAVVLLYGSALAALLALSGLEVYRGVGDENAPQSSACQAYRAQMPLQDVLPAREEQQSDQDGAKVAEADHDPSVQARAAAAALDAACEANALSRAALGTSPWLFLFTAISACLSGVGVIAAAVALKQGGRSDDGPDRDGAVSARRRLIGLTTAHLVIEVDYRPAIDGRRPIWSVCNLGDGPARITGMGVVRAGDLARLDDGRLKLVGIQPFDVAPGEHLALPQVQPDGHGSETLVAVGYRDDVAGAGLIWACFVLRGDPLRQEKHDEGRVLHQAVEERHKLFSLSVGMDALPVSDPISS